MAFEGKAVVADGVGVPPLPNKGFAIKEAEEAGVEGFENALKAFMFDDVLPNPKVFEAEVDEASAEKPPAGDDVPEPKMPVADPPNPVIFIGVLDGVVVALL